jgi:hypothetical protein
MCGDFNFDVFHLEAALGMTIISSFACFTVIKDRCVHNINGTWKKTRSLYPFES